MEYLILYYAHTLIGQEEKKKENIKGRHEYPLLTHLVLTSTTAVLFYGHVFPLRLMPV